MDFVLPVPPRSYTQLNSPARHCPSQVIYWQHKALLTDLRSITIGFIPKFRINLQNPPCSTTLTYDSVSNDSSVHLYDSRRLVGTFLKWEGRDSNPRRLSRRIYSPLRLTTSHTFPYATPTSSCGMLIVTLKTNFIHHFRSYEKQPNCTAYSICVHMVYL